MPKRFPLEFRRDVVTVAQWGNLTQAKGAVDFNVSLELVRRWLRQADVCDGGASGVTSIEAAEVVRLRRNKRRLEMKHEILRRAAAYFAKDALPN